MAEAKTIRVKRCAAHPTCDRFDDPHGKLNVWVTREYAGCQELDITITPVLSREERLREARLEALNRAFTGVRVYPREALEIIERVDAEFAKGEK